MLFSDPLTQQTVLDALQGTSGFSVQVCPCTDSTNRQARQAAAAGAAEGLVVLAGQQTAGRGRLGRSFFSPGDTGLYLSLVLRPSLPAAHAVRLTCAAAVAVCEALEQCCGVAPQIKWVNDIFLGGKKVCGILTEAVSLPGTDRLSYAVLGVGINVYPPTNGWPAELADLAGSVCGAGAARPGLRARLAAVFLQRFSVHYRGLQDGGPDFLPGYRDRSLVLGRRIFIEENGVRTPAKALAIDEECRLTVQMTDGSVRTLSAGEISIRPDTDRL